MHKVSTMQMALISVFVVGALSGCAGGLEIPGLGAKKDPGSRSVGQPTAKTGVGTVTARSDTSAQSVREIGKPKPGIANHEGTTTAHANRLGSIIQIASADTTNAGLYHRSYERSAADSPSGDRPPTGWIKTTASTGTTLGVPDRSLGTDGGDRGKWWEAMQASQRLDAERSRIARAQIAQGTAKPSGQSGATDLASANKEFNNPLTAATLFITENDTVFLGGDLADGTKVTNITVIEPVIPVPLGNTGWALINRPILPIAFSAPIPVAGSGGGAAEGGTFSFDDHDGLGDFTFFSMLAPPRRVISSSVSARPSSFRPQQRMNSVQGNTPSALPPSPSTPQASLRSGCSRSPGSPSQAMTIAPTSQSRPFSISHSTTSRRNGGSARDPSSRSIGKPKTATSWPYRLGLA